MGKTLRKEVARIYRHKRIRKKIFGTPDVPRLVVTKSNKNIYTQIIDDSISKVLVSASSRAKEFKGASLKSANMAVVSSVGELLAKKAVAKGIKKVAFDRGGYIYHGKIKALAEAARKGGLEF